MHIIDKVNAFLGKISSFLSIIIMVSLGYEVLARYVFQAPTIWASEATTLLCGFLFLFGGAYTLLENSHVSVDIFYSHMNPRKKAITDILTFPFAVLWFVVLIWTSFDFAWMSITTKETLGTAWDPPIYFTKAAIPVASFMMLLQVLSKFYKNIRLLFEKGDADEH